LVDEDGGALAGTNQTEEGAGENTLGCTNERQEGEGTIGSEIRGGRLLSLLLSWEGFRELGRGKMKYSTNINRHRAQR